MLPTALQHNYSLPGAAPTQTKRAAGQPHGLNRERAFLTHFLMADGTVGTPVLNLEARGRFDFCEYISSANRQCHTAGEPRTWRGRRPIVLRSCQSDFQ